MKKLKRLYKKLQKLRRWIPIIWNTYDWDYQYAVDMFRYQLEDMAEYLKSNGIANSSKDHAQRIKTITKLMKKVYNDEYTTEYQKEIDKLYGKSKIIFEKIPDTDLFELKVHWPKGVNVAEANKKQRELMLQSAEKHERAHKLLWGLIEHNIQYWWD